MAVLTPYLHLQILIATLGGWLVFSHLPDQGALAGMALVAVCGVVGTRLARREAVAAAPGPLGGEGVAAGRLSAINGDR